jgi:hypothetical protein
MNTLSKSLQEGLLKPILLLTLLVAGFLTLLFPTGNNINWVNNQATLVNTVNAATQFNATLSSRLAEYCIDRLGALETTSPNQHPAIFTKDQREVIPILSNQEITSYNRLFFAQREENIDPDGRLGKKTEVGYQNFGQDIYQSQKRAYKENLSIFKGNQFEAGLATWNPAYSMVRGGYEASTGMGLHYNNLGQNLSNWQRVGSGIESGLGAVGTVGVGIGGASLISGGISSLTAAGASSEMVAEEASTSLSTMRYTGEGETFYHYGYSEQAAGFEGGLRPGGFATSSGELSGVEAQKGLALPRENPPNAVYSISPKPGTLIRVNPVAEPLFGRPGGLPELQFPFGTESGTVSSPILIK